MRNCFNILIVLSATFVAGAQSLPIEIDRTVQLPGMPPPPRSSADRWTHGFMPMFTRDNPPEVWMYNRNGKYVIARQPVSFPDAHHVEIQSVSPTPQGTLLISAEVWQGSATRSISRIAEMIPDGSLRLASDTASLANQICSTSTGEIVALGMPIRYRLEKSATFDLLSRYSQDGKLKASNLTFHAEPPSRYELMLRKAQLVTSPNGTTAFYNGDVGEWTEFDPEGKLLQTLKIPLPLGAIEKRRLSIFNIVMTSSKEVYASLADRGDTFQKDSGIFRLDRSKLQWTKIEKTLPSEYGGIYGSDGDSLITRSGMSTYAWFRIAP